MNKLKTSIQLSWQHGRNLGLFVFIYKLVQCLLTRLYGKQLPVFSFVAGIIGAFFVWKEKNSVNQQICFYLLSRVLQGIAQSAQQAKWIPDRPAFSYISILCWGIVMYLFEANKSSLQPSLTSSMQFLYKDSDKTNGWRDFVPFYIPDGQPHKHAGAKSPVPTSNEVSITVPRLQPLQN
jgi:peroxisomal membrane protein 4